MKRFLILALMPLCASADWTARINHDRGECGASLDHWRSNGIDLLIVHPTRAIKWQVAIVPGQVIAKGHRVFPEHDHTYDWAVMTLNDDTASHEWIGLPNGLQVMVDAAGFQAAWAECLTAFPPQ